VPVAILEEGETVIDLGGRRAHGRGDTDYNRYLGQTENQGAHETACDHPACHTI
jgi:hypothetical protein